MLAERAVSGSIQDLNPAASLLEEVLSRPDTRRGFGAKALALLGLFEAACSGSERSASKSLEIYVKELPESPIKQLLITRALPYFGSNRLARVNISGYEIPVYDFAVTQGKLDDSKPFQVFGEIDPRNPNIDPAKLKQEELIITGREVLKIPLPGLVNSDEIKLFPQIPLLGDGTPYQEVSFETDVPLYEGVNPLITILRRKDVQQGHPLEKFTYIKELSGFLVYLLYLSEVTQKSRDFNIPVTIKARRLNGDIKESFVLADALAKIESKFKSGRLVGIQDRAAYIMSAVAVRDSEIGSFKGNATLVELMANALRVNLGSTEEDVIKNALAWSRDPRNVPQLQIAANMRSFP